MARTGMTWQQNPEVIQSSVLIRTNDMNLSMKVRGGELLIFVPTFHSNSSSQNASGGSHIGTK